MPLIACGIDHRNTPLAIREQASVTCEQAPVLLNSLLTQGAASEAMLLSTCNRTEIYGYTDNIATMHAWLAEHPHWRGLYASPYWYWLQDEPAVNHIMQVTVGIKSMLLGEPQIKGQVKTAFQLAQQLGTIGTHLHRLLQSVFAVTKQIRNASGIGKSPVSVAYAGVQLARRIFAHLDRCAVLLIGSGETIELAGLHLMEQGVRRIVVANRSLPRAQKLAQQFCGHAIRLEEIPVYLSQTDILISATASPIPILGKGTVERAIRLGKRRPRLMIDLAVPRDIEPEIAELEDIYLYNIDHLQAVVTENLKSRQQSAEYAEAMIEAQARYFMRQLQINSVADTIRAYRDKIERLRIAAVHSGLQALRRGESPEEVLAAVASNLTNKIMHIPTIQLRQAAFDGQSDLLLSAQKLLDL